MECIKQRKKKKQHKNVSRVNSPFTLAVPKYQDQTIEWMHPSAWCQSLFSPALEEDVEWNEVLRRCEAFHSSRLSLPLATLTGWMC